MNELFVASVVVLIAQVPGHSQEPNPLFVMSIEGPPCGVVVEGLPGTALDDGTGGVPLFEKRRPGVTLDVLLSMKYIVEQFWLVDGYQWTLGTEGPFQITDATFEGSVTRDMIHGPPCLFEAGWEELRLTGLPYGTVGPRTAENHGAYARVLWSFQGGGLPGVGDYIVGKVRVTGTFPEVEGESVTGQVFFEPRYTADTCYLITAVRYFGEGIHVTVAHGNPPLVEISCPITLLDCNADQRRDVSDAIYALGHLYLGAPPPPAPFPECGRTEETAEETCPEASTACR